MGLLPYYSKKEQEHWEKNHLLEEQTLSSRGYVQKNSITWTKDGVEYQVYVALNKENIKTTETQREFLINRGYKDYSIINGNYHDNYDENYTKKKNYFEKHGFVPRWEKNGELFDWESALDRENFSFKLHVLKES